MEVKLEEIRFGEKNKRIEGYKTAYSLLELCELAKNEEHPYGTIITCFFYVRINDLWLRRIWCDFSIETITNIDSNALVRKFVEDVVKSGFKKALAVETFEITL